MKAIIQSEHKSVKQEAEELLDMTKDCPQMKNVSQEEMEEGVRAAKKDWEWENK